MAPLYAEGNEEPIAGMKLPFWRLNNPFVQNLILTCCLFFNPGLYLAVALLGAGGGRPSSVIMADTSNGVLYGVFTFSAILASSFLNTVGPRLTVLFALTGYPVYIGSLWYFDVHGQLWFPVVAGAYLGVAAGCLWTTATFFSNVYAEEREKGAWRAIQWIGNTLGAIAGGCVALGLNWNATSTGVPQAVYIIFIVLQCVSIGFGLLIKSPGSLIRPDGTRIADFKPMSMLESLSRSARLFRDIRILLMLPAFLAPEMFFPFQSSMNAYAFNLRTRSLNSVLLSVIQLPTASAMGWLLDNDKIGTRRTRALIAVSIDAVWITGAYIAQTIWLASWRFDRSVPGPSIDITDRAYPGAVVIYLLYAAQYGMFQNVVIWMFGALTNDPPTQAAIGGLFVGIISAGTAISFGVDATAQPYENENAGLFALATLCWPLLFYVAWNYISETNYFVDEAVIVPMHVREEMNAKGLELASAAYQEDADKAAK